MGGTEKQDAGDDVVIIPRRDLLRLWKRYTEYKQVLRSMESEI